MITSSSDSKIEEDYPIETMNIFCEGDQLKTSLIDAEKTYNIIDEIRAKQAQKTKFFMVRKQKSPE